MPDLDSHRHTWTVSNIDSVPRRACSEKFSVGGHKWQLSLSLVDAPAHVSLYLHHLQSECCASRGQYSASDGYYNPSSVHRAEEALAVQPVFSFTLMHPTGRPSRARSGGSEGDGAVAAEVAHGGRQARAAAARSAGHRNSPAGSDGYSSYWGIHEFVSVSDMREQFAAEGTVVIACTVQVTRAVRTVPSMVRSGLATSPAQAWRAMEASGKFADVSTISLVEAGALGSGSSGADSSELTGGEADTLGHALLRMRTAGGAVGAADFEIHVGDKVVHAHRLVLAARSRVFRAMLAAPLSESRDGHMRLEESVQPAAFEALLHYMYTDELPAGLDDVCPMQLLQLASMYEVEGAKAWVERMLVPRIDLGSVLSLTLAADGHNAGLLLAACIEFMARNFVAVQKAGVMDQLVSSPERSRIVTTVLQLLGDMPPPRSKPARASAAGLTAEE